MRISNSDLSGAAGAESARTQELQKSATGEGATSNGPYGGQSGDRVEFSSGLGQLARAISTYGSDRASQVQKLATLYQGGGYRTDSAITSQAMVSDALSGGIQ
jgi:hypothetical protein